MLFFLYRMLLRNDVMHMFIACIKHMWPRLMVCGTIVIFMRQTSVNWKWALLNASHRIQWINWILINSAPPPFTPCRHHVVTKIRRPVSNTTIADSSDQIDNNKNLPFEISISSETVWNGLFYFPLLFSFSKKQFSVNQTTAQSHDAFFSNHGAAWPARQLKNRLHE